MTREEAIDRLRKISEKTPIRTNGDDLVAITMAIKALSQEPTNTWSIKDVADTFKKHGLIREQEPCDDAISREAVIKAITNTSGIRGDALNALYALPSVNPQPCDDAISRDYLFKVLDDFCGHDRTATITLDTLADLVYDMPSVTQKTGRWIEHPEIETSAPEYLMFYECSECGDKQCFCKSDIHKKRFCNNCGARMVESQERSDKE